MRYFVIGPDGQKYGPADIPTLNAWIAEGRLLPTTMLEDESTGTRLAASAVSGLNFPLQAGAPGPSAGPQPGAPTGPYAQPGSSGPVYSGYPRATGYVGDDGSKDMQQAWIFGVLGLLCCGLIFGILGINAANRAKAKGHPNAQAAFIFNIVVLVVWAIGTIINIAAIPAALRGR